MDQAASYHPEPTIPELLLKTQAGCPVLSSAQ
jgi:hypothetical protein